MKESIKELATGRTKEADVTGSATSSTALEPSIWLKKIVDGAKDRHYFMNFVYVTELKQGQKDAVIPYRSKYLGSSGITYATSSPNAGTGITATKLDNFDGVTVTPSMQASRISIGNYAIRTNAIEMIREAQNELMYSIGDKVDAYIATTIGDAASSTSSATGAQTLYGGDATSDATLEAGDVITTDLVVEARKLLMSKNKQYRTSTGNGGGYGAVSGTVVGNPWMPTPDEPFVLFIGPAQEEAFLKDSQFTNASEYGSNKVIMNGEIGEYMRIKVISTNNVEQVAVSGQGPDAESATVSVAMTRCIMMKAKRAAAFVWGQRPVIKIFDNVPEVSKDIVLEASYQAKVIHSDAIVFIDVADA